MLKGKFNKLLMSFSVAVMMLITSNVMFAQDTSSSPRYNNGNDTSMNSGSGGVTSLVQDLQSKLNLTQTQADSMTAILTDYQSALSSSSGDQQMSGTSSARQNANTRIEAQLNSTQKSTWDSIKSSFWSKVDKALGSH
jgi:Spy/CpxP family protein refolding chaperone